MDACQFTKPCAQKFECVRLTHLEKAENGFNSIKIKDLQIEESSSDVLGVGH